MNQLNESTGVMEDKTSVKEIMDYIMRCQDDDRDTLDIELIKESRNHGGKPMLHISWGDKKDIQLAHIEISELGVFCYFVDDGVS